MHAAEAYGGGGIAPLINLDTGFRRPGRFPPGKTPPVPTK